MNSPNVIIVLTDDQGYADVGCFGAQGFATPHLDRMADEGIRFTNCYCAAAVCSPSRAALLTGCYPVRVGVTEVLFPRGPDFAEGRSGIGLNPLELTIAELLKSCGYATAAVGKWHLGDDKPFLPTRQGFDEYFGLPYSNDMRPEEDPAYPPLPLLQNEEAIEYNPDQSELTTRYTQKACDFIARNRQRPFFLYLAHTMPHVPLAVSDEFAGRTQRGLYGDVVTELDGSVGRILQKLDELGIADNTLVVFASDNGPWLLYGNHAGSAGPLREGKTTTFDGGQRVPCIMRWPDRIHGKTVSKEVVTTMDLLPTIAAITGASLPRWPIDGRSILPILEAQPGAASPHEAVYFYDAVELQAVRSGPWKLHLPHRYPTVAQPGMDGSPGQEEWRDLELSLFDLDADPGETTNVAAQHPELVSQLMEAAAAFDADIKKNQRPVGRL
ncbi:MAG: sulfatase [Polyangiaceae bacterium]|nr:sulfatase [Polyangiaceae bacterium]